MSAPMKSRTSAWIVSERFPACSGMSNASGGMFRDAVPLSSAAKTSADRPTPSAVLRPSSATAMPVKPMRDDWMSENPIE